MPLPVQLKAVDGLRPREGEADCASNPDAISVLPFAASKNKTKRPPQSMRAVPTANTLKSLVGVAALEPAAR